jgi:hypothetical protein
MPGSHACDHPGCEAAFAKRGNLAVHKRTHTGEKPFRCDHPGCEASFTQRSHLVVHKRTHTGERPFRCEHPGCGAAFSEGGDLAKHKRTHTGERPFRCKHPGCGASFSQSGGLAGHKRIHTGEKPFRCDHPGCEASFAASGDLAKHKRAHTGEKPFRCDHPGCGASFSQNGNLTAHKRIHTGETPFQCDDPSCKAMRVAFARAKQLTRHRDALHTKEGRQRRKRQEEAMKNALVFAGYAESFTRGRTPGPKEFIREAYFDHRCALARDFAAGEKKFGYCDFVVCCPSGRLVFLEVDESQHEAYSQLCETTRMFNICASIALSGEEMNVFWLRLHPDRPFWWKRAKRNPPAADRRREVVGFLDRLQPSPEDKPMEIGYAFYDCKDGKWPDVLGDAEYRSEVRPAVVALHDSPARTRLPWRPTSPWPRVASAEATVEGGEEVTPFCVSCNE